MPPLPSLSRAVLALSLSCCAGLAWAQPRLLASDPAERSRVAPLTRMELGFSEKLLLKRSDAHLTMTSMPGMQRHPEMGMAIELAASQDARTLVVTTPQPLPRGTYRLDWRAVSARHKLAQGSLNFSVD